MGRPRLSLMGLMGTIAILGLGFATWRIPWLSTRASALFVLVVFILLTATLGALLNRGASWIGFALFGWGWLLISFLSLAIGHWQSTADRMPIPMPIVSMWLMELRAFALGYPLVQGGALATIPTSQGGNALVSYSLVQICHLEFSLLSACIGGALAKWLDHSRRRPTAVDAGHSIPSPGAGVRSSPSETTA